MLACLIKLQLFQLQKGNGHIFKCLLHCSAKTESMYILFFNIFIYFFVTKIMILSLQCCVELYTLQFLFVSF